MRIKFFNNWKDKYPKEISYGEWYNKYMSLNEKSEYFTDSEYDFFENLIEKNTKAIYNHQWQHTGSEESKHIYTGVIIYLYQYNYDQLRTINIYKIIDDWFLLSDYDGIESKYYMCDQFEELVAYISKETVLSF